MNKAEGVLISPLGLSPGAVSGVYFKLAESFDIRKVITLGTSDPYVITAADKYLAKIFAHKGVAYEPVHIPDPELRGGNRVVKPYVALWGLMLKVARQEGRQVHVAVTAGRSGMGALAALAASLYGADYLWHFWVREDIENQGSLKQGILRPSLPARMVNNALLNPTVEENACDLVALPFANLRPLHALIWEYRWTGALPNIPELRLDALLQWIKTDDFEHVFPAGITFAAAQQIMDYYQHYTQAAPSEQAQYIHKLGDLLQQRGVVNHRERELLIHSLLNDGEYTTLLDLAKEAKDYTGFWQWLISNVHVVENSIMPSEAYVIGLSSSLLKQLRTILPNLYQFSSDLNLRALFVDQRLKLWQHLLPEANNPYGRVNIAVDFLFRNYNSASENGLVLLLQVLLDQMDPADANYRIISDTIDEVKDECSQYSKQETQVVSKITSDTFFWQGLQLYLRAIGRV